METKTLEDLIEWTRQVHERLAKCLAYCATCHEDERARTLLEYLASHERTLEKIVQGYEEQADRRALRTWVYDYLPHKPIDPHRACDMHYAELSYDEIRREVFDFHAQIITLYRELHRNAPIPEARALFESLLAMEEHETMRLSLQVGRMDDL